MSVSILKRLMGASSRKTTLTDSEEQTTVKENLSSEVSQKEREAERETERHLLINFLTYPRLLLGFSDGCHLEVLAGIHAPARQPEPAAREFLYQ